MTSSLFTGIKNKN